MGLFVAENHQNLYYYYYCRKCDSHTCVNYSDTIIVNEISHGLLLAECRKLRES